MAERDAQQSSMGSAPAEGDLGNQYSRATSTAVEDGCVYEGGEQMPIFVEDLVGNKIAIKQLVNDRNSLYKKLAAADRQLSKNESEIEYLKTSPFVASYGLISNVIGGLILAAGVNLLTANSASMLGLLLIGVGATALLTGGSVSIMYPFARRWFNREMRPAFPSSPPALPPAPSSRELPPHDGR